MVLPSGVTVEISATVSSLGSTSLGTFWYTGYVAVRTNGLAIELFAPFWSTISASAGAPKATPDATSPQASPLAIILVLILRGIYVLLLQACFPEGNGNGPVWVCDALCWTHRQTLHHTFLHSDGEHVLA